MTNRKTTKLETLLHRIREATKQRGTKTELADYVGAIPQQVNAWLSGRVSPGGEVTLLMLEWVTAEEEKQKGNAGSAITPPAPKTRKLKSHHYEKSKRVRKEK